MPKIQFSASAYHDFIEWYKVDQDVFDKIPGMYRVILSKGWASQSL
jgi:hypothetical protein